MEFWGKKKGGCFLKALGVVFQKVITKKQKIPEFAFEREKI